MQQRMESFASSQWAMMVRKEYLHLLVLMVLFQLGQQMTEVQLTEQMMASLLSQTGAQG